MSSSATEPSQRAKNEAEVLKLIFGENLLKCQMYDVWKRFSHLQVCIRVGLTTANGQNLSVDIDFNCPPEYPELPPKFTLLKPIGLTQEFLSELTRLLNNKIKKSAGSELIYDLCVDAQNLLQAKNVPEKSMHERMLNRQEPTSAPQTSESIRKTGIRNSFTEHEDNEPVEVKKEEELKCRRDQLLKRIGTLGNNIKVELTSKPGQLIDIAKIMDLEVLRKPVNNFAIEWFGFDQNNVILVTEYRFDSIVNKRNKEDLVNFEMAIKKFVNDVKIRTFPTDNFLTQYAFCHWRREKRAKFSLDLLIGQYIDLDSKCLGVRKVVDELKSKKSVLPKFANHLLCGLKTLHEQRFLHGLINLNSIWMNSDNNFIISDHSLMPEILNLYEQFGQINVDKSKQRQPSVSSLRLKDFQAFGDLMKNLSSNFNSTDREVFDDFIVQCSKPDIDAQRLLNHRYLYQGFTSMSNAEDESLLSSANMISTENAGRLVTEYNILGFLGSGGFGSVFLARNKLDGNDYAIKRISLSGMSNKQVERIKNEVAVFSKLSHEHITRYYSSWVETVELKADISESSTSESYKPNFSLEDELPERIRNLNQNQEEEEEISEESSESSSSSSSNGIGFFRGQNANRVKAPAVLPNVLSQGNDLSIMFAGDESDDRLVESSEEDSGTVEKPKSASFLCLQMEYCSNKTLRSLIDYSNLYTNSAMLWRIFKEILLGLQFIHSYNLIHRDVKPGNIFLDSNWSVKIGDFGLATRLATVPNNAETTKEFIKERSFQGYSMTKDIGTMLYIPPEAKKATSSSKNYDEKFDIYSTGIVLFEMIMKPPDSRSERISCLEKLKNELLMPDDLMNYLPEPQRKNAETIIKWCLKEDPMERPSANELLEAKLIPNIISDEDKFQKTCIQIAQDPKHRLRHVLFNELFNPVLQSSIGFLYDKNHCIEMAKRRRIFTFNCAITDYLSNLFRLHGFTYFPAETIFPSPDNYPIENNGFAGSLSKPYKLIDENGIILTFPTNLRHGLTRYCIHNGISRLKSYSIDKTYSQTQNITAFSAHPDVRFEFCLDIIRPENVNSDSTAIEILQLIIEISQKLRPLSTNRWQILLNHTALLKAIGMQFSINDRMASFFNLLYEFSSRLKKVEYSTLAFEFVRNFNMSEKQALELIHLLDTPLRSIHKLREHLRPIINTKNSQARTLIETSISTLDLVFQSLCHNLDTSLELTFLPSFVYQPLIFSDGIIFSLRVEINDKGKKFWCPILGGGQYDSFLRNNRQANEHGPTSNSCAYGFNLSVENAAHLLRNSGGNGNIAEKFGLFSSVLISCTSSSYYESGLRLANQLREISISVELWNEESALNDTLFDYCWEKFINFIVVVVSVDETVVYVNTFDKSFGNNGFRLLHNRIPLTDAFKFVSTRKEQNEVDVQKGVEVVNLERFESNVPATASISNVNIIFSISRGFKITHHLRKKYESHVNVILANVVKRFHKNIKIDAYITELSIEILKQIANLERTQGRDQAFVEFESIANNESSRYKKDVMLLFDELETFFQQPTNSNHVVFLFCPRYSETFYRILM